MAGQDADEDGQRGVVINTASVAAYEGQIGQAAYAASKGGVGSLTIARSTGPRASGIRVNTIAPASSRRPCSRPCWASSAPARSRSAVPRQLGAPEEYAEFVLEIVAHDFLNGETIRMDGALRMAPR